MASNEYHGDLREIATKLGVPPTIEHINQRIGELEKKCGYLTARSDHLHHLAYMPLWKIILFRAQLFFVYPIARLFR